MTPRSCSLYSLRVCFFALAMGMLTPLFSQTNNPGGSLPTSNQAICSTIGNNLCVDPLDDFVMALLGCATGTESVSGLPPFTINVPPGEDLQFQAYSHPDSILRTFFIMSLRVASPPFPIDYCDGETDPELFAGPIMIERNDAASFTTFTVPSAVVDQMVAASNTDGFVVFINADCNSTLESFVGAKFTRNPAIAGSLNLSLIDAPDEIDIDAGFKKPSSQKRGADYSSTIEFEVTNNGNDDLQDVGFLFSAISGGVRPIRVEIEGQPPCNDPNNCTFDIAAGETLTILGRVIFTGLGRVSYFGQILSDRCEDNGRIDLETNVFDEAEEGEFIAMAKIGPDTSTEIEITNTSNQSNSLAFRATDKDGFFASSASLGLQTGTAADKNGNSPFVLDPGETRKFVIPKRGSNPQRYLISVKGGGPILAQIRQQIRQDTRAGISLQGTSQAMVSRPLATQGTGQGLLYHQLQNPAGNSLVVVNYNQAIANARIVIRNAISGTIRRELTNIELKAFEILEFPMMVGVDENTTIELISESGVTLALENNRSNEFQVVSLQNQPAPRKTSDQANKRDTSLKRQPFFQPNSLDFRYDPSVFNLFLFGENGAAVPMGNANFSFDFNCGFNPENSFALPIAAGIANATVSATLPGLSQVKGGYGQLDTPGSIPSLAWDEGTRRFWIQASLPRTSGRIILPKTTPLDDPNPQIAEIKFQLYSDAPLTMPVAIFNQAGELLNLLTLFLEEPGGHLLCNADFGLTHEAAYLEFQVPEDHPSDVWFDALADVPELDYKDQLPVLDLAGPTTIANISSVLDAWDGGSSCLGDMPDMNALVAFVNNNFMCPAP